MADIDRLNRQLLDEIAFREDWKPIYQALHHLFDLLRQTRTRTGGDVDEISNQQIRELLPWSSINSQSESSVQSLFSGTSAGSGIYYSNQSTNYTATDFEFVNASLGITVTLPQYPVENSVVYVRNSDGTTITVSGNGKNISYRTASASKRTTRKGTILEIRYLVDSDEWVI